jgi:hypothetical protein
MAQAPIPTRITIDFHDALHPARGWILGLGDRAGRVELLAFANEEGDEDGAPILLAGDECTCPEFCELDHGNA